MTFGFELIKRSLAILVVTLLVAGNPSYSDTQVSAVGVVQASDGLVPKVGSNILEQGQSLEVDGSWGDALAHYEEALRDHPGQHALQQRFDNARLHYSFDRRIGDHSFRQSVEALSANQASEMVLPVAVTLGNLLRHTKHRELSRHEHCDACSRRAITRWRSRCR